MPTGRSSARRVAAVDLGASSGRVMVATVGEQTLELEEVHRFGNGPVRAHDGSLRWDASRLRAEILAGLSRCGHVDAIGVDAWAVDYGLLDAAGELLGDPYCYRDSRTDAVRDKVISLVSEEEIFATTGLQQLPFNTIYQLAAEASLDQASTLLLIPDLVGFWLTGEVAAEATNASTTQLYDVRAREWAADLAERVDVPMRLLPAIREPGAVLGTLLPEVAAETGLDAATPVVAVGSHDTASAVVGVPFEDARRAAYISSGTWSLVGVEADRPMLTDSARQANFTNEGGVDGTIRFLRNVMGLWMLSECQRAWGLETPEDLRVLLSEAEDPPAFATVIDVDDPVFLPPGDMPDRIARWCSEHGVDAPQTRPATVRCLLESLALAYRDAVQLAARLSGQPVEVVHVVGGGARNELLCRLTADACGVPVLAGPVEATALGNVLVQARALGADLADLAAMRSLLRSTQDLVRYDPTPGTQERWAEASRTIGAAASAAAGR
jgi:rhamnulokinase